MDTALWAILLLAALGKAQTSGTANADGGSDQPAAVTPAASPSEEEGLDDTTVIVIAIACTTVGIVIISVIVFYFCYMRQFDCRICCCADKDLDPEPLDLETPDSPGRRQDDHPELPAPGPPQRKAARKSGRELAKQPPRRPLALDPKQPPKTVKTRIIWKQSESDTRKIYCVQVQGSWDNYGHFQTLQFYGNGVFQIEMELPPQENLYRFLVDGAWGLDEHQPTKWDKGYRFNCLDTRPERGNQLDKNFKMDQELAEIPFVNMNFREKVEVWFERNGLGEKARRIVRESEAQSFEELRSMDRQDIKKLAVKAKLSKIEEEKLARALQKPSGLEE